MRSDTDDVRFPYIPPFLFDCRLRGADGSTRRMGLGDIILQIALIQAVAANVGRENVGAFYNTYYPGARDLWEMSLLPALPVAEDMETRSQETWCTVIPMRHHILEHPLGYHRPCVYGHAQGSPLAQALFNLGWHGCIPWNPLQIDLTPREWARAKARTLMLSWSGCVIACQPLEVTRGNRKIGPEIWRAALVRLNRSFYGPTFAFGCARHDVGRLTAFIEAMRLPASWSIVTVSEHLQVWKAIIDQAAHLVTGNTSGMWLGIASQTPMTVLGIGDNEHGQMWDPKPDWFTAERLKTVNLETWQHFQNTMPMTRSGSLVSSEVVNP